MLTESAARVCITGATGNGKDNHGAAKVNRNTERAVASGATLLLGNPAYPAVTGEWLSPAFWGDSARPVAAGGRGGAWFIHSDYGDLVLRRYLRGGLVARLSRASYVFTGFRRTRALAEFRLLNRLRELDLPVPEPVAALVSRQGLFRYRAAILLRRIPNARPLPEVANLEDPQLWRQVGQMLRAFHDAGLDHVDLNCDNILVADGSLWLIDFDRCRLRRTGAIGEAWKVRNLTRLKRSVGKRCRDVAWSPLWGNLLQGYHS
ncbi:3-deoxy-D-manno-octulosonic acid kinase [Kineobactrum sediminis]|uniref:3-deoxy-D-manno-octulosonic acid kinase n=1 Tax=Kineobactrum sediminis TaxID=1905677 RepID=A0A2N5Y5K4_9GAMM|nr:3-deoxy-D-manno-octulosonic acid kinase [Kineobactrum sediminis]